MEKILCSVRSSLDSHRWFSNTRLDLQNKNRHKACFCFVIKNSPGWTVLLAGVKRVYGCRLQWLCHFAVKPSPSAGSRSNLKQGFALWFSYNFRVLVKTKAGARPALILTIKNSPGWTRTNNLPVNSRLLRH